MYPVQHPVGTPETNNINLLQRQVKIHKNLMLGPEIVTDLATTRRDPATGRQQQQQPQHPTQGKSNNNQNFLTEIIGTVISQDKHDSMKSRIKCILHIT